MTSQGSPHSRFRRAVATGNPLIATAAAQELGNLSLADALALTLVYADRDQARFERAALRWHGRLCLEVRDIAPRDADLALAALRALGGAGGRGAGEALGSLLEAVGESRAARAVDDWLGRTG